MKKKIAFLLAMSMVIALSACGEVDTESTSQTAAETSSQSAADTSSEEAESSETAEETSSETPETTSSETVSSEAETVETAEPAVEYETFVFTTPEGDYSYEQLHADGLANKTRDGIYYALVSNGGGAGHQYYKLWATDSGEWAEKLDYQTLSGNNTWFALDDGKLVKFYYQTAAGEPYPQILVFNYENGNITEADNTTAFANQTFDDGQPLDAHGEVVFSALYEGGYNFWLTFTGEDGSVLDKEFTFAPETFDVIE